MSGSSKCPHFNFQAQVNVARMEDTGLKYAEVTIRCVDCGKPAQFRGLPWGLSPNHPTAGVGNEEVNLPFLCEGDEYNGKGIGFSVKVA